MNGRFEEKLAQIAFEDASPEEIAKIERRARRNPEAARALSEFRQMKSELKKLSDTPAHQLSNERLREAILAQGLHPKPLREPQNGLGAGWLWMPVAAALLGVAFVKLRHRDVDPQIVLNPIAVQHSTPAPAILPPIHFEKTTPKETIRVAKLETPPRSISSAPSGLLVPVRAVNGGLSRHDGRRHHRARRDAYDPWDDPSNYVAQNLGSQPTTSPPAPPTNSFAKGSPNSPIVIIDADPDSQTGAPGATEVGTASNVVIGG